MSLRSIPLFDKGRPTPFLQRQWAQRGGAQPLLSSVAYLDAEGRATTVLRGLWAAAMPTRDPLPFEPLAEKDGRGTQRFWDVFE